MPPAAKRTRTTRSPLLGAHMSIAGGTPLAVERAESVGATALQIFLKNSNRWQGKAITDEEAESFRGAIDAGNVLSVCGHSSYLLNFATPDDGLFKKSIGAMVDEIHRADSLGVPFIVLHPGSHMGRGEDWGIERVAEAARRVFDETPQSSAGIAFETTAGTGDHLGHRFEQLAAILDAVDAPDRTGACFDTCHVFAAGYDLRERKDYLATLRAFDETVGLARLQAIHLNDSKTDLGSRRDRHEHIGRGLLGKEPFRHIMNDRRLNRVPKILETPKGPDLAEDRENLEVLRGLIGVKKKDGA